MLNQYLYQLACCKPDKRFRIANTSPTPASVSASELGSGVATAAKVRDPDSQVANCEQVALFNPSTSPVVKSAKPAEKEPLHPSQACHVYVSPGRSPEPETMTAVAPNAVISMVKGAGNDTSGAVGRELQTPLHVKVGVNESA